MLYGNCQKCNTPLQVREKLTDKCCGSWHAWKTFYCWCPQCRMMYMITRYFEFTKEEIKVCEWEEEE